jgi:exodeoxyribonuclease VII large subunit
LNAVGPRLRIELVKDRIARVSDKLETLWSMAKLVHPDRPLSKGFARVTSRAGKTLTQASDAAAERLLTLHFRDGRVDATAGEGQDAAPPATIGVERKRRATYVPPQPGLFDEPETRAED